MAAQDRATEIGDLKLRNGHTPFWPWSMDHENDASARFNLFRSFGYVVAHASDIARQFTLCIVK